MVTKMRVSLLPPISKPDALASIAYLTLAANGKACDPTLHDIASAVVQAAPLLNLSTDPEGVDMEIDAISWMCERHNWKDKKVVVLDTNKRRRHRWRQALK
jgi:hypothetical protein